MIVWCAYCQALIAEKDPYDDPSISHGMCPSCEARLERGEELIQQTEGVRQLMHRLLDAASRRDRAACDALLARAHRWGVRGDTLLVGLLQPALYQAGRDWQDGRMPVATEHWLTSWCEEAFASVPTVAPSTPLDIVIFQTPGNIHTLGPRFAAKILAARGLSVEAFVPALPFNEMAGLVADLRPRVVGFSCSLPDSVPVARDIISQLRALPEPVFRCRYVVSGHAFRMGGSRERPDVGPGIDVVVDVTTLAAELAAR